MAAVHPFIPLAEREEDIALPPELQVVLPPGETPVEFDGALQTPMADGGWEIAFDGEAEPLAVDHPDAQHHYANLAEYLTEGDLSKIAQDVDEMVKADLASRSPWYERLAKGLELLGVIDEKGVIPPFDGASTVVHPLVAEAIVQYQARALVELFPATGPAKTVVMGDRTSEKVLQAERVADFMNYQLTFDDKSYFAESDRLLFLQGSDGSVFRKVYHDFLIGKNVPRLIKAEDFIVPYSATTLEDSPRYTHRMRFTQNEMKRLQNVGFYRDCQLAIPEALAEDAENQALANSRDENQGRTDPDLRPEDREHCVYEMVVEYDLPGFRDTDAESGEPTEIAVPYVISVERDSLKVLSIRRQWKQGDPMKRRMIQVVHYPFIRGDGFYGYGLFHLAGNLGKAATGTLRVILDNAAWAALQGGFKTKEGKLPSTVKMAPGRWIETESTLEELQKSFYTPPFKEVPQALFHVLGLLTELGQRLVSTTDATVGDAKNTGPVGTTVALIEQGQKVTTGVHKRSHEALGTELRLLADLNGEFLPEGGYPYEMPGASKEVFREDFGPEVDVLPVSDPNIFSSTQRIAIAQTGLQLADSAPDLYNRRVAHRRLLEAMKMPDIDEILPPPTEIKRCDPVTENARAMVAEPIKVFPDQHHDAHIAVHFGQLQMLGTQQAASFETFQQIIIPHIAEHEAQSMRIKMMQGMGIMLPPVEGDEGDEPHPELSPELETMIAVKAAEVMQALTAQLAQRQAAAEQGAQVIEQEDPAVEERRKDMAFEGEERRKDVKLSNDIERDDAKAGIDPMRVKSAAKYLSERGLQNLLRPRQLAVVSRELDKSFDETVRLIMFMRQAGQGAGPAPHALPTLGGQPQ